MASTLSSKPLFLHQNPNSTPTSHSPKPFLFHLPTPISLPQISSKTLSLHTPTKRLKFSVYAASTTTPTPSPPTPPTLLSDSTRSIASLLAIGLSVSNLVGTLLQTLSSKLQKLTTSPTPNELAAIQSMKRNLVCTVGPLFFAAMRDRPSGYLNTPLTVVAAGMSKWLDIYSGVLMVRVLLSWFPNIPWDRQPLSAIRDLCDPYLNLFRNIIPPVFDTLDVSPLLAFAVLGTLGSILNNSRGTY